jgi:hypothetical protein
MNRTKNVKKEERKMSNGKKVKIVIEGIILLFIVYCVVLKMLPVSTGRLSTYEEINDAVATAASRYKNTVTLKTTGEPYMDYQSVLDKLMEKNMYAKYMKRLLDILCIYAGFRWRKGSSKDQSYEPVKKLSCIYPFRSDFGEDKGAVRLREGESGT